VKYHLFDYQREAALGVIASLQRGQDDWERHQSRSSFALSAVTGAGKTVIATAVIEAMLYGTSDLGTDPDPRATFLWVTDDPALNRQTKSKMLAASDLLQPRQLQVLGNDFLDAELKPGMTYFLNIQQLSKNAGLAQGGRNLRQHSMWDVIANTINNGRTDLYVVVDEAHKGMRPAQNRKTIVQRIISGEHGSNPPVPVVWGISATIERFEDAMKGITGRTSYPYVQVDLDKVRASGLIKDEIGLDEPDEKGTFGSTLLREAVKATLDYEQRWDAYTTAETEPRVLPVLVMQVPDKASPAKLAELLQIVEEEWPSLGPDAVVHVFGEHEPIDVGDRRVRWVHPESVQGDSDVRVVLAKEAISTGWDCPRAEVLYSERPAKDSTRIAQIIGRMVRQPLAQRIATDDALNSVICYLPLFDRKALATIKAELEGKGKSNGSGQAGPAVARAPKVFEKNPTLVPEVFDFVETLPSVPAPDSLASPLRRAKSLAKLLADDVTGSALVADAGEQLSKTLNAKLDGLAAEHADAVADKAKDLRATDVHRSTLTATAELTATSTRTIATHMRDIDRDTRKIIRGVKEGAGQDYYAHRVEKAGANADKFEIRISVAALLLIDEVVQALDDAATKWVQERLDHFAVEIKNTTGATRNDYLRVQEQTVDPEPVDLILRDNLKTATRDGDGNPLPRFSGHLYADDDGQFPVALNKWERNVVETEVGRPSFVAWYRNPSRATAAALRIAYQTDAGGWTSLQPDFLVISKRDDGTLGVSIIDPHGDHLADAKNKIKALARYAERFGDQFVRIESITEASDGTLRSLDLKEAPVREAVESFTGAEVGALYEQEASGPFK